MKQNVAKKSLQTRLVAALLAITVVSCGLTAWVYVVIASHDISTETVASEANFMQYRAYEARKPFENVQHAHGAANKAYLGLRNSLSDERVEEIFQAAFTLREDGTYRFDEKFFEGTVINGHPINGFAAFFSAAPMTIERKRTIIAALEAIRTVSVSIEGSISSLAFATPDNDMIIFAPERPDKLEYYRSGMPADFDIWGFIEAYTTEDSRTVCSGPNTVGWDPTGKLLAAGCQTTLNLEGEVIGIWDSTLPLNKRVDALLAKEEGVAASSLINSAALAELDPERPVLTDAQLFAYTGEALPIEIMDQVLLQADEYGAFESADGAWIVRYLKYSNPDWLLIDLINRRELMANHMRAPLVVVLLLLVFLLSEAAFIGLFVQLNIIRPIVRLEHEFADSEGGAGDSDVRALVSNRSDELGSLAKQLFATRDGYVQLINELEERVEERTREYQEANMAKTEFLANMSHELRTPLNGVIASAQLMNRTGLNDKQKKFAGMITKSGTSLLGLINNLLDISKIEAGEFELEKAPFSVAEMLNRAVANVQASATSKGIMLKSSICQSVESKYTGDIDRLVQVVTNLAGNAIKFTDVGSVSIEIETSKDGRLKVSVSDTGVGIPTEKIDDVFGRFAQVDATSTKSKSGTGLGLAISKDLVEMMGGDIGLESTEGKGATFWFAVPLEGVSEISSDATEQRLA